MYRSITPYFMPSFALVRFPSAHSYASFCALTPASTWSHASHFPRDASASLHSPLYCLSAAFWYVRHHDCTVFNDSEGASRYFKILIKLKQYVNRLPSFESLDSYMSTQMRTIRVRVRVLPTGKSSMCTLLPEIMYRLSLLLHITSHTT